MHMSKDNFVAFDKGHCCELLRLHEIRRADSKVLCFIANIEDHITDIWLASHMACLSCQVYWKTRRLIQELFFACAWKS